MHPIESQLDLMRSTRPDVMTPNQRDLAETQHNCREKNDKSHACSQIATSTHAACADCLVTKYRQAAADAPLA